MMIVVIFFLVRHELNISCHKRHSYAIFFVIKDILHLWKLMIVALTTISKSFTEPQLKRLRHQQQRKLPLLSKEILIMILQGHPPELSDSIELFLRDAKNLGY